MGLCFSCRQSKDRFKAKTSKICSQIQSAVSPIHINHDTTTTIDNYNQSFNGTPLICAKFQQNPTIMATSFSNMNITNPIKGLVSKKRNRYKQDGFDLDLTYITSNIIAMGYPASSIEGVYRNHIDDVVKFLDTKHKDHYYIYNLCSERSYDKTKFHNRVKIYPFDDHNPPKIESIQPFCNDVNEWLLKDDRNLAAVHCKAGKGRTGTMICCYLLHSGLYNTAEEALNYYGQVRTQDRKGVTIPSQVRYVKYYEQLVRNQFNYMPVLMYIKEFILNPVPQFAGGQGSISFSISQQTILEDGEKFTQKLKKLRKNDVYEVKKGGQSPFSIKLDYCLPLSGDIKVEFYNKPKIGPRKKLFRFWFNTFFVCERIDVNGFMDLNGTNSDDTSTYVLNFKKNELDIINKKIKQDKVFSQDFQLTLILQKIPNEHNCPVSYVVRAPSCIEQGTPSESSDSSDDYTNEEDDWDSVLLDGGEHHLDPRGVGYRILSECEIASQLTSSSSEQQPELLIV